MAQYAVVTPAQPLLMIDADDSEYYPQQRYVSKHGLLLVWVIGKNPQNPQLPLGLRISVSPEVTYKHLVDSTVASWCPSEWHPEQLIEDLAKLYSEIYPYHHGPLRITQDYVDRSVSKHAPEITRATAGMFSYISKFEIESVSPTSPEAQGGRELTTVYVAPGHSRRSPFQLLKNLYLHLTPLCWKLPGHKFRERDIALNWDSNASALNNIVENYPKQKKAIAAIISQSPQKTLLTPFLWRGGSESACADYAEKRKKDGYEALKFTPGLQRTQP